MQDDFVEVGLISRPHGVRGEVKVQLITDEPKKRLGTAGKRYAHCCDVLGLWAMTLKAAGHTMAPIHT